MTTEQSPPTTLSEERLRDFNDWYFHNTGDISELCSASREVVKVIYDAGYSKALIRAAEQMARYEVERTSLVSAVEDAIRLINHLGGNPNFQVKVLKSLPPAPENQKGGVA